LFLASKFGAENENIVLKIFKIDLIINCTAGGEDRKVPNYFENK